MKIIRIKFPRLLFFSFAVIAGIFFIFRALNTDKYLVQITDKASFALGRQVSIGHLGFGLSSKGITLDAWPVIIADDQAITAQPFIKVDKVRVKLDLKALVFLHQVHISDILLQSPQIHFIRSQEGVINVLSLGHKVQPEASSANITSENKSLSVNEQEPVKQEIAVPSAVFNIKSIRIQDATISFIDQTQGRPLDIWLSDINANLNTISLDPSKHSVQVDGLSLQADLSQLDNKDIFQGTSENSMLKNMGGIVQFNIAHMSIADPCDLEANGNISLTGGVIRNFNIIKTVLSHTLGAFGGVDVNIDDILNGSLKDTLGAKDTGIEKAEVGFSLHDKVISIDNALIKTSVFEITANGSIDQGLDMDMQTVLHLNEDVSTALSNTLGGLKYLLDDSKRISIDASLTGTYPDLKYKPNKDFRKKSKKAINAMFRQLFGA